VSSTYENGQITFRILGKKDPSMSVKIETSGLRSWGQGEQVIRDSSVPAGRTRVVQRGSAGRAIYVERVVYKDGQVVKREPLGESVYPGMKRIVAEGSRIVAQKKVATSPAVTPTTPTPEPDNIPATQPPPTPGRDGDGGR
jgi:hypothetical protein